MHESFADHWLFKNVFLEIKELIYDKGVVIKFDRGDQIIEEEQPNGVLFIVLTGKLTVARPGSWEGCKGPSIASVGPGGLLGDYSFIDGLPASATVTAEETSLLYGIGHDTLREVMASDQSIAFIIYKNLLEHFTARLRHVDAELENFFLSNI